MQHVPPSATPGPDQYVVSHVRDALAQDTRVTQLDLDVIVAGGTLYVSGDVPSADAREAVGDIVREYAPGLRLCNETRVATLGEPSGAEEIG